MNINNNLFNWVKGVGIGTDRKIEFFYNNGLDLWVVISCVGDGGYVWKEKVGISSRALSRSGGIIPDHIVTMLLCKFEMWAENQGVDNG